MDRRASAGNASCSALSSCKHTTSGSVWASHARRFSSRLLTLLILKVAIFTAQTSNSAVMTVTLLWPSSWVCSLPSIWVWLRPFSSQPSKPSSALLAVCVGSEFAPPFFRRLSGLWGCGRGNGQLILRRSSSAPDWSLKGFNRSVQFVSFRNQKSKNLFCRHRRKS